MTDEKKWVPTWLYRLGEDNEPEGVLFETEGPADMKGWFDAPGKVKKRGRPPTQTSDA